ncbi:MAG: alpha/beta hydrolase [Clostridia bacterium]|nr:alpha/beta hydrolase [Clostridia bacterium]
MDFNLLWIILGAVAFIALLVLSISFYCFYRIFYSDRKRQKHEEYPLPPEDVYRPYHERMIEWIKQMRATPHQEVEIKSFDGLTLRGKYFEYAPNAPIELMLHGYRGECERDLAAGVVRAFEYGKSVLMFDHRASGKSDGKVITFGVNESRDCMAWIDYILKNINPDAKIILSGVSMGASTVMICASKQLPKNVVGVIADCGFTSAKDIIQKVMKDMGFPPKIFYPFAKLGAKLFGKFDVDEFSAIESMKDCRLPILFIHGDQDYYVPFDMSRENYEACSNKQKKLVFIEGAGHGLAYPENPKAYVDALKEFIDPLLKEQL